MWFSHFSSIHLFLGSSCQTFCTLSFSTVGVLLWLFKPFEEEKLLSHLVHLNALSPVWVLSWSRLSFMVNIHTSLKQGRLVFFTLPWKRVCAYISAKACEEHTEKRFCVISAKPDQLIRVFLCQEQSLDLYGLFEPKTNPLDHSIQKIRVLLDRMYSPFLFSFIV